jgi:short subunit dehydrogenase-like uncharacterized protein
MPDILVFGATGYTGRLVAQALAEQGADFAVAGRSRPALESLAARTGGPEVRVADATEVASLLEALDGIRVLLTCVGPFVELGETAVEAALRSRSHYLDSAGESAFVARLIERDTEARSAGIAIAPAMGFDEVPADVAATLACEGLSEPELTLTYALPSIASRGTLRSALGIITQPGRWIAGGRPVPVRFGDRERWAPMPPPLGPRLGVTMPMAIGYLAPLHLRLETLKTYATTRRARRAMLRPLVPVLRSLGRSEIGRAGAERLTARPPDGPGEAARRARWTILAEAGSPDGRRNVVLTGRDVYGLSARLLATGATIMATGDYRSAGVLAPVQAFGLETLQKVLIDHGVTVEAFSLQEGERWARGSNTSR